MNRRLLGLCLALLPGVLFGSAASGVAPWLYPSPPTNGQIWVYSTANNAWIPGAAGGAGTVTSIGPDAKNNLTFTPNPITGAGTIGINLSNANTWAAAQTFPTSDIILGGSSTGTSTFASANASATNYTITFPAATGTVALTSGLPVGANPSATINSAAGTVTNGSASTFMRSDGAPALPATMTGITLIDGNTVAAASDTFTLNAATQTLTNKSIAGSEINSSTVANTYGGTGQNTSASTGVAQVASGTWSVSTALASGTTATTQAALDNSTKVSTTAYTDAAVAVVHGSLNSQSAAYTTVLSDQFGTLYHPSSDTTARTFTIASNANVAYPLNTIINFFNDVSAGVLTIAINSDTLVQANAGTTGSVTLAAGHTASALKVATTRWVINVN